MSVVKMFLAGTTDDLVATAQFDVSKNGTIVAFVLSMIPTTDPVAGDQTVAELSFASTPSFTGNDIRQSLAQISLRARTLATGHVSWLGVPSVQLAGLNISVNAGERIHLHHQGASGGASNLFCYIYIDDGLDTSTGRGRIRTR